MDAQNGLGQPFFYMAQEKKTAHARVARAQIACCACRSRKVRCDVARRGAPCNNCLLDSKVCLVSPGYRQQHKRLVRPKNNTVKAASQSTSRELIWGSSTATIQNGVCSPASVDDRNTPVKRQTLQNQNEDSDPSASPSKSEEIGFAAYGFLTTGFLRALCQDDVRFLEEQFCLHVPQRDLLDEFITQYFLHLHPAFPLLDQTQFLAIYHPTTTASSQEDTSGHSTMSLFLLQAILFGSCRFVSAGVLHRLGYSDVSHARRCLYRKAKLLYLLGSETRELPLSQGALLLSLATAQETGAPAHSIWLAIATQHAQAVQASPQQRRRLWWTCLFIDRVTSLELRRPLQITAECLDLADGALTMEEFQDEMAQGSEGRSIDTAMLLLKTSMAQLCGVLTEVLGFTNGQSSTMLLLSNREIKLSLQPHHTAAEQNECLRQNTSEDLEFLLAMMESWQSSYEWTEQILHTAHRVSSASVSGFRARGFSSWLDVLLNDPHAYLHLVDTMDAVIATKRIPSPSDLQPLPADFLPDLSPSATGSFSDDTLVSTGVKTKDARQHMLPTPTLSPTAATTIDGAIIMPNLDEDNDMSEDDRRGLFTQEDSFLNTLLGSCLFDPMSRGGGAQQIE
ncbi:hypothetical protein FE257_004886 [Aspergillus nanangensis]|uniref:Zn(2)-C6 fungal-type domain-containing protein n=1 Tax=Aspergillus nanangensis TaxID=2582783 RepID=A0AAD4CAK5_ASPNN|nr:hypothetical protein FE257_004886 [Aspergillus nanangensis]